MLARSLRILILTLLLLGGAASAPAQTPPDALDVQAAIRLAQAQHPRLNALLEEIRAKSGAWWQSFGLDAPRLTYFREGMPTDGSRDFDEQRWTLSQSIDFPLQSYYRLRRVGTEEDALRTQLQAERAQVTAAVKKTYTDLLYAQEIVHLRTQEQTLSRTLLDAAVTRVEAGEASELEQMKADIQMAEATSKLEDAERQFQNARYALFRTIGLDPEQQRYRITFPDTLRYVDVTIDQERVLAGLDRLPDLASATQRVRAAELGVKQTRSTLLPDLQIDLYPQDFGAGYDRFGLQVGLSLPLWVVPNHRGAMRQAKAQVQQAAWERTAVALDLKKEAEQAWHGYATSRQTIERYRDVVRARARELLARTQEGYRLGEIDLLTLLDTQRTVIASELRFYDALRDYYHRLIELERFLGRDLVFAPSSVSASRS